MFKADCGQLEFGGFLTSPQLTELIFVDLHASCHSKAETPRGCNPQWTLDYSRWASVPISAAIVCSSDQKVYSMYMYVCLYIYIYIYLNINVNI